MTGDHVTTQGTLTTAILSNIILSFQILDILICWEGVLTDKDNNILGMLIHKPFHHQNSLGYPGGKAQDSH